MRFIETLESYQDSTRERRRSTLTASKITFSYFTVINLDLGSFDRSHDSTNYVNRCTTESIN